MLNWPKDNDCPDWELKKVTILIELGELKEAERILEKQLNSIRIKQQSGKEDIYLLSIEGWSMLLLSCLKRNTTLSNYSNFDEPLLRWKQLKQYDCNPWDLISKLKSEIIISKNPLESFFQKKISFDPGQSNGSYHLSNTKESIRPYYQFINMFEEGYLPYEIGVVQIENETLFSAIETIFPLTPLFALTTFLRSGKINNDFINQFFSRESIANMSLEKIKIYYLLLSTAWEQCYKYFEKQSISFLDPSINSRIFESLTEILSRLLFRLELFDLNKLFESLFGLNNTEKSFTASAFYPKFEKSIENIYRRLFLALPEENILTKFHILLKLPSFDESDLAYQKHLPDPINYIEWIYTKKLPVGFDRSSWNEPINMLLWTVRNGNNLNQILSLNRIEKLLEIEALNDDELIELKKSLREMQQQDLFETKSLIKKLVDQEKTQEEKNIENSNIKKFFIEEDISKNINQSLRKYLYHLIRTSKLFVDGAKDESSNILEWSNDEITSLLTKLLEVIKKIDSNKVLQMDFMGSRNDIHGLSQAINYVVYPKLIQQPRSKENEELISDIYQLLKPIDPYAISILPGFMIFDSEKENEFLDQLTKGILSKDNECVKGTLDSIYFWNKYQKLFDTFPKLNKLLIETWITKIVIRQEPELIYTINSLIVLLDYSSEIIQEDDIKRICQGLEMMFEDTNGSLVNNYQSEDDASHKDYRWVYSKLAFSIKKWHDLKGLPYPKIIQMWKERSEKDVLPEIWKYWRKE